MKSMPEMSDLCAWRFLIHFKVLGENTLTSPSRAPDAPFPEETEIVKTLTSDACFSTTGSSLLVVFQSRVVLSLLQEIIELGLSTNETEATAPSWPVIPRFNLPDLESIS